MNSVAIDQTRTDDKRRRAMAEEAKRIEYWARTWDYNYRRCAHRWLTGSTVLVVSGAVLAAGAAATGLGDIWTASLGPGLLALGAAIASGVASAVRASTQATEYNSAASASSDLADAARVFQITVVYDSPLDDVSREFEALCRERDAVVSYAPITGKPKWLTAAQLDAWPTSPSGHNAAKPPPKGPS